MKKNRKEQRALSYPEGYENNLNCSWNLQWRTNGELNVIKGINFQNFK